MNKTATMYNTVVIMPNRFNLHLPAKLTLASAAAVRGANFATAKFRDAYGNPLEAFVMFLYMQLLFK
jgi:hypothetical protein